MHFRHRQTDTDIVAYARDVYITSRTKNELIYNQYKVNSTPSRALAVKITV